MVNVMAVKRRMPLKGGPFVPANSIERVSLAVRHSSAYV